MLRTAQRAMDSARMRPTRPTNDDPDAPLPGIVGDVAGHARGLPADAPGRRRRTASVLLVGETGTGKEADRPRHPSPQPARRRPLRPRQLRRPDREPAGKRAVRPRQGGVHRGRREQDRPLRGGPRRHDLPRRNLQHEPQAAGQAAARPAGEASSSASARAGPSASTPASSPPPTSSWKTRSRPAASATTCIIGSTWCRSTCRRCASGARTSRPWRSFFLERYSEENRRDPPELTPEVLERAAGPRLAGQRPRAGELHGAGGGAVGRRAADARPAGAAGPVERPLAAAPRRAAATCKA